MATRCSSRPASRRIRSVASRPATSVNHVAKQVGGKGGGKPDMAMAGGTEPAHLPGALASVSAWVAERI
jgi:alanyl-tRNA synthetase